MPSDRFATEIFIKYLHDVLHVRHIYVIFESHPYTRSIVRGLRESIQKLGWAPNGNSTTTTSDSSEDDSDRDNNNVNDYYEENVMYMEEQMIDPGRIKGNKSSSTSSSVSTAIENLKRSQFRFVISLVPDRSLSDALMYTAYIAKVAGGDHPTDTGDGGDGDGGYYYWWAFDTLNLILAGRTFDRNDPQQLILAKAYNSYGSIVQTSDKESKQYKLFTEQAQKLKQQLYQEHYNQNEITNTATTTTTTTNTNTMTKKNDRWLFTTPNIPYLDENDWFRNEESLKFDAAAYAYDATILIGMSVCREVAAKKAAAALAVNDYAAIDNNTHLHLTGEEIYERIKVTNFTGVSGYVLLDPTTGSRNGDTVRYVIQNSRAFEVRANNGTSTGNITFRETVTDLYRPGGDYNWENIAPFIYVNGEKTLPLNAGIPPLQLKQEGINPLTQVVGLTLFGVLMTATIGFAIWTCKHRATKVVRASQPFFLYLLCKYCSFFSVFILRHT